jgi:hypothetical protein
MSMVLLILTFAIIMFMVGFVALGEWLNSKFHFIDMTEENTEGWSQKVDSYTIKENNKRAG